jgi:Type IIA topoisomerase (DNA gyrase/topo II, topoisomerase IV), A subunit
MRIVIELRADVNANLLLNNLYKHTQLEDTFGVNMLALVNNEPKVLNLLDMLKYYIRHQENVVTRRTKFDLGKAEERAHILEGLLIAIDNIDEVIKIIRGSENVAAAVASLIERFGLTDVQAKAIVDMRLRALTGLEREKLEAEYEALKITIAELKAILADKNKLLTVIRDEISVIADKYGDDRRTKIGIDVGDFTEDDLIDDEQVVIAMTHLGYIKRMTVDNFHAQGRGGKGIKGMQTIEDDYIEDLLMTTTLNYILFFTNRGRVYKLRTYQIPEAGRTARGTAIVNLLQLEGGEKVSAIIPIRQFSENKYLIMCTKKGLVKKTPENDYLNIRKNGLIGITLREDDELIEVKTTDNTRDIFLVTKNGMCIRFKDTDVRSTGRASMGVIGMNLDEGDEIVGMQMNTQGEDLLIVSENGMGKRTPIKDFKVQKRGGMGLKCYKLTEKTGNIIGVKAVNEDHEIMMITTGGIIIQLRCADISRYGRITSGVKLIELNENVQVASIAKVRQTEKSSVEGDEDIVDTEAVSDDVDTEVFNAESDDDETNSTGDAEEIEDTDSIDDEEDTEGSEDTE